MRPDGKFSSLILNLDVECLIKFFPPLIYGNVVQAVPLFTIEREERPLWRASILVELRKRLSLEKNFP
jgi:hypothetical protein